MNSLYFLLFFLLNSLLFASTILASDASAYLKKSCTVAFQADVRDNTFLLRSSFKVKILEKNTNIDIDHIYFSESFNSKDDKMLLISPIVEIGLHKTRELEGIVPITLEIEYLKCVSDTICDDPIITAFPFEIDTSKLVVKPLKNDREQLPDKKNEQVHQIYFLSMFIFVALMLFIGFRFFKQRKQ